MMLRINFYHGYVGSDLILNEKICQVWKHNVTRVVTFRIFQEKSKGKIFESSFNQFGPVEEYFRTLTDTKMLEARPPYVQLYHYLTDYNAVLAL